MLSTPLEEFTAKWLANQPVIREMADRINVSVEDFARYVTPRSPVSVQEVDRGEPS